MRKVISTFLMLLLCASTSPAFWEEHDVNGQYLYGYADVGADPFLYMPEVESNRIPTNVQSLAVSAPSDDVRARVAYLHSRGQRAIIVLDKLLFKKGSTTTTPCDADAWRIWRSYPDRFAIWSDLNRSILTPEYTAAVVINTEVNNRCIPVEELDTATQHVKSKLPSIPTLAGYGRSPNAKEIPEPIPSALAGILFFRYGVFDPNTDADYLREYEAIAAKLTGEQRIILVPDGYYGPPHASWPKWYLGYLALNYAYFAQGHARVVGLVYLQWPDFLDEVTQQVAMPGTRSLPQNVRDKHRQVGCLLRVQSPLLATCS